MSLKFSGNIFKILLLLYSHRHPWNIPSIAKAFLFKSEGIDPLIFFARKTGWNFKMKEVAFPGTTHFASLAKRQLYKNNIDPDIPGPGSTEGSRLEQYSCGFYCRDIADILRSSRDTFVSLFPRKTILYLCDFSRIVEIHGTRLHFSPLSFCFHPLRVPRKSKWINLTHFSRIRIW